MTSPPLLVPRHVCRMCGRPYSPTHDASAPGPNVRHPYVEEDPSPEELDAHEVETGEVSGVGYARCACGAWEAVVTGPASARWAFDQYREHLRRVGLDATGSIPPG